MGHLAARWNFLIAPKMKDTKLKIKIWQKHFEIILVPPELEATPGCPRCKTRSLNWRNETKLKRRQFSSISEMKAHTHLSCAWLSPTEGSAPVTNTNAHITQQKDSICTETSLNSSFRYEQLCSKLQFDLLKKQRTKKGRLHSINAFFFADYWAQADAE
jgi:hypothetical protein